MKVSTRLILMSKKNDNTRGFNKRMKTTRLKKNARSYARKRHLDLNILACIHAFVMTTSVQLKIPTDRQEDDGIDATESIGRIATWINVRSTNEAR